MRTSIIHDLSIEDLEMIIFDYIETQGFKIEDSKTRLQVVIDLSSMTFEGIRVVKEK